MLIVCKLQYNILEHHDNWNIDLKKIKIHLKITREIYLFYIFILIFLFKLFVIFVFLYQINTQTLCV
jgi:hypothetical protein